jgi:hypothetical protein
MQPLLRLSLLLTLLTWAAALLVTEAARQSGHEVIGQAASLLLPPNDCPAPCWHGIRPGETSSGDGIERLGSLSWVTQISVIQGIVSYDSIVRWDWTAASPSLIDRERDGRMWTHNGSVYLIELPVNISLAVALGALGPPDEVEALRAPQSPPAVFLHVYYQSGRLALQATVPCPATFWQVLAARVNIELKDSTVQALHADLREAHTLCQS